MQAPELSPQPGIAFSDAAPYPPKVSEYPAEPEHERGIRFDIDSLPYCIRRSPLSELRSGEMHLSNRILRVEGRNTVPDYLRAKLYTIGSLMFLPGIALAYLLIEQVSWIPASFQLRDDDIIAYALRDEYNVVSILFNPSGTQLPGARRTVTFQLKRPQYLRVAHELQASFPGKQTDERLTPAVAAGSSAALIGIAAWTALIIANIFWQ